MPNYNLTLNNFQISETRSLLEDTDYLSFTLQIGLATPQTLVKSMGSIGKGTHTDGRDEDPRGRAGSTYLRDREAGGEPKPERRDARSIR
jgi:hypothetical protein